MCVYVCVFLGLCASLFVFKWSLGTVSKEQTPSAPVVEINRGEILP